MELVKESTVYALWLAFLTLCRESAVGALCRRCAAWCEKTWQGSGFIGILTREGTLPRSWPASLSCRLLTIAVNLPLTGLHWLYRKLQASFDGSFFARLAFEMGDATPVAISWLMALILTIPYDYWNNAYSMLGFAACLLLLAAGGMRRKQLRLDFAAVGPYPVLFAVSVVLAVVLSTSTSLSIRFLLYHISCMLCVAVTVSAVRHAKDLVRLTAGATLGVFTSSAYAFIQRIQGVEVNASYVDLALNEGMPGRVDSFFDNPNAFAEMLIFFLPLLMVLPFCCKRWYTRLASFVVFAMGGLSALMTYSRASWVGFAFAVVVFVFLWRPKLLPLMFLLGVAVIPFLPPSILNRILTITNMNDSSTSSRFPLYQGALNLIERRPVLGAGLGTEVVQEYIKEFNLYHAKAPFVHAHNMYLQVWIETGLLGVTAFVASMLFAFKSAAAAVKGAVSHEARFLTLAGASAIAGACVCGMADYLWNYPRVMCAFWFLVAIVLSGIKVCKMENSMV